MRRIMHAVENIEGINDLLSAHRWREELAGKLLEDTSFVARTLN